ncbi:ubiquinol-cytochrome c reductase cytochrome b/c1 subunit [Afipia massiliensis]|uniref:Cytochrome b n=1 Tax=Afipia massiliensis TaxID=211460 RepID=A0A840N5B3_9BRAD|nr:cytochrome c1 [Afipia massiliensis]MBB5053804.1 ubiquinol-cytochrome c reductase cytochrome b/c1 subunit [Afipia massiliensis]
MSGPSNYNPQNPALKWVERRLPIGGLIHSSFVAYPTPRNLNYWWTFGAILSMMLGVQIITGVILAMHYTPHVDFAFKSVELIVRDVNYGWLLRYLHSNGASMFFIAVYIHMFRGLYYGSYKEPREVLWILGVIIYLLMMATGFMGYVLPWGQMSFWGATVITNLFSAIPYFGESIVTLLWGGYSVGNPTLNRFFSLHYLLPFVIAGVVVLHVWALHVAGQNNPAGVEPKTEKDTVPFTPYATLKDAFGMVCFLLFFAWFLFYIPNYLGDPDNYIPANPAVTPAHIVPEWYYLPFYAILRSIPNKLAGVIAMFSAIIVLAFLPWLDSARTRSSKYRPLAKQFFWIFVAVCFGLGWLGAKPAEGIYVVAGRVLTFAYFAYFLIVLPILSRIEKARPLPNSIAEDVLRKTGKTPVSAMIALAVGGTLMLGAVDTARAAEGAPMPPSLKWSFAGPFGKFDQGQLQRGLKVYKEVCAACHGLSFVAFRNLADPGGPGYSPAQAAAFASEYKVKDGPDDKGEMFERNGRPADYFPSPYPNEQAARASNGGAFPPDLSLIAKARGYERGFPQFIFDAFIQFQEKGPNYLDALMQGYEDKAPAGFALPEGSYYNKFFPGHAIKMPKPLSDGQVTYDDGSPATVQQYAKDVSAFLMWTAEPHLEARKRLGLQVMLFLIVLSGLLYFTKKKVWADAH